MDCEGDGVSSEKVGTALLELRCGNFVVRTTLLELSCDLIYFELTVILQIIKLSFLYSFTNGVISDFVSILSLTN